MYLLLLPVALIVLLDEWIKFEALRRLPAEASIAAPYWIEFAIHKNFGLAFDIPFRMGFVVFATIVIGGFLLRIAIKNFKAHPEITFASSLILLGALGNLFDRIVYGFTVDYMIFFSRSAINFSDATIILGVLTLLLVSARKKNVDKISKNATMSSELK
ncbi:MAG: signal peptidase II [Patescibacteria group bacterium]